MYTCGPTVYDRKHIGNFRTYTLSDILFRVLKYQGYQVTHIMNFTDVGHLSGDNLGDADTGEDRLVKAAKRERKTAWEVAKIYSDLFIEDFTKLNLLPPSQFVKATDHIPEQIELIKRLEEKGLTYKISDGIYFNTLAYEKASGKKYGELSDLDQRKAGARVAVNREKKNSRDFSLWRFSYPQGRGFDPALDDAASRRDMEWNSPWGVGFPGWHIECSAMSLKYLANAFENSSFHGERSRTIDFHVGGEDIKSTHHPNEIAQSQGATGKKFVNYWLHGAMVLIDGVRMSTSLGNNYKMTDIIERGFDPIALRYLYLQTHYRQVMNFTWTALEAAATALDKLRSIYFDYSNNRTEIGVRRQLSKEKLAQVDSFREKFVAAIYSDLNMPEALAVVWQVIKSNIPDQDKSDLIMDFDEVLGLQLESRIKNQESSKIPEEVLALVQQREILRKEKKWQEADKVRKEIESQGFSVKDVSTGPRLTKKDH